MTHKITGDAQQFDKNWRTRAETNFTHWTRTEPKNQIQLAFRNHWTLFQELQESTPGHNKGNRVLEVGCGRGSLSCYYADKGYDCTLLDLSPKAIDVAKDIFAQNKLSANFEVGDACNLNHKDESFDLVFSIGLLEHFEDIEPPLKEQIRILDKGGLFIGYVVPEYKENVQKDYFWVNDILKNYQETLVKNTAPKAEVYRSDSGSERYIPILEKLGLKQVQASGVYPLPMISHSIDFPFSLMPDAAESVVVERFNKILADNKAKTGKHGWLCEEGYGQAFLIWGVKA